ncbi:hypothetical protein F5Y04DRAFT_252906 [Hypomontagnella monticulosa]|nr:hypothetical protein F5Y04DRAFT_252906 [Hypomontagnella monticulosa]
MSGSSLYEGKLCCAICGDVIPPLTSEFTEGTRWQTEAVLLSDPTREFEQLEEHYRGGKRKAAPRLELQTTEDILKTRAHVIEGDRLRLVATEGDGDSGHDQEEVRANNAYGRLENGQWDPTPYYIATHGACLEVAEITMRSSPHNIAVRDLRTLWKVLRMRFEVSDSHYMGSISGTVPQPQRINMPHSYYMLFRPPVITEPGTAVSKSENERWEAAYPLHVPDLTAAILDNLRDLPLASTAIPEAVPFREGFVMLPPELREQVCSLLVSRRGMPSSCNGLMPQWVWRELLLDGTCLPFLWDLDIAVVKDFCARWDRDHKGEEPNWELLVRKLSQQAWCVWDAESSSLRVPNGLRNRRRIWKLVEEMYVGDFISVAPTERSGYADLPAVPMYWDRGGDPLYPVVRAFVGGRGRHETRALI